MSNYLAGMEKVRESNRKASESAGDAKAKFEAQNQSMEQIGRGLVAVGALALIGMGLAVKKFSEFDSAMSNVQAATQETTANMGLLRDAALDAGARTVYSATEAANAIEELGKNGLTTAQILDGGLDAALSLAAAGQLEVGRAAEIAAITMKQFNLEADQLPHVADLLAAGAGKAAGDVEDLAQALNQSALVANSAGLTIEETTGVLSSFADAGLVGSDAGTAFKSMLQRLTPISAESAAEMKRLGISAFDASGNFIGAADFAGVLQDKLHTLTDEQRQAALAQIFGSDAVRAANVLYDEGAEGIQKYIDQTNDSGYAAKVAADRLNNLGGDVEKLGGALDTALIKTGTGANDVLRSLTQIATGAVDAFGQLPEPVLAGGLALTALVGTVALTGGAFLLAVPKVAQFKLALATLNVSGSSVGRMLGITTGALVVAGAAFAVWADRQAKATAGAAEFQASLDESTGALTEYTRELAATKLAEGGVFEVAKKLGISQKEMTDAFLEGGDALEKIQAKFTAKNNAVDFFNGSGIAAGNAGSELRLLVEELDRSQRNFDDVSAAADESAGSTGTAAEAYQSAADTAAALQSNLDGLIDTINTANGVGQDAVSTNAAYQQAMAGIADEVQRQKDAYAEANGSLDGFTLSLDQSTASGSANAAMLSDIAGTAQTAAEAQYQVDLQTMSAKDATDKYVGTLATSKQALIDQAIANGYSAEEVQKLIDKVYAVPDQHATDLLINSAEAASKIAQFVRDLNNIPGRRDVIINQVFQQTGAPMGQIGAAYGANGYVMDFFAAGGIRENHVAQIAPAGTWRVWAEPETGGESYIPLAPSKRARSLDIWAETGARLGVTGYASGAVVPPVYATAGPHHATAAAPIHLDGVKITGRLDIGGDGLARIVDGRIWSNNTAQRVKAENGNRR